MSKSNEKKLLVGALYPTLVAGAITLVAFAIANGKPGFYGALVAQLVVLIYFAVHLFVSRVSSNLDPVSTMSLALFSYFAKFFFFGLFLWALSRFTSPTTLDRVSFGISATILTLTWLGGEVASYLKLKTHLPLPTSDKKVPN